MEVAAKALTDELSQAAKNIHNASNRLQKDFAGLLEIEDAKG